MKKTLLSILLILTAVLLLGCQEQPIPEKGDFTFSLPEGYSLSNITDKNCDILREDGTVVGGIILTEISQKDMKKDSDSPAIPRYLDSVAGPENMSEYFCWLGDEPDYPTLYMSHYVTNLETKEKTEYKRLIFVRDGGVYDLWLDPQIMDENHISDFNSIVETQ